jgi:hypothetical protein
MSFDPNRRFFVLGGITAIGAGAGAYAWFQQVGEQVDPPRRAPGDQRGKDGPLSHAPFDPRALATLSVLVDDLLPGLAAEGLPKASEVGVMDHVIQAVQEPGFSYVRLDILKLTRAVDLSAKERGAKSFAELGQEDRAAIIHQAVDGDASRGGFRSDVAMEVLMTLALEGYLGHPAHGGNRDGVVWKALGVRMPLNRDGMHGEHHPHAG